MAKVFLKLIDGLGELIKQASVDRKLIGGLYETVQMTTPIVSSAVSAFEKVSIKKSQSEMECIRQKEMTNRANIAAEVEKQRIELLEKEIELKRATLPLIEREFEARRAAENFFRIQQAYAQRRADLHTILNALQQKSEDDGDK